MAWVMHTDHTCEHMSTRNSRPQFCPTLFKRFFFFICLLEEVLLFCIVTHYFKFFFAKADNLLYCCCQVLSTMSKTKVLSTEVQHTLQEEHLLLTGPKMFFNGCL